MKVKLDGIGKRYRNEWILKNVSIQLNPGERYAISGPNGSGKSTLLKIISGHLSPSKGKIQFFQEDQRLDINSVYLQLSFAAPYIELIEDMTLREAVNFHRKFKPFIDDLSTKEILNLLALKKAASKPIKFFSSGMKQRLKLILAICSKSSFLLLDEPSTNLDKQGIDWYLGLIDRFARNRLVIVASNVEVDYQFCDQFLLIEQFK